MNVSTRRALRPLVGAAALALTLIPGHALAGYTTCSSDPLFYLSNKHWVQVTSTINDTQSNVKQITYTVHGPAGTSLSKVTYSTGWSKGAEQVVYAADQAAGTYTTDTLVQTVTPTLLPGSVSSKTIVDNQTTSVKTTVTANGWENQDVLAQILAL